MRYRTLGRTGIRVSAICQGGWSLTTGDDLTWGATARQDALGAYRTAFEAGVNFFDTARTYGGGESEELLAEALGSRRDEIVIATKLNDLAGAAVAAQCEQSLLRLRTDRIDLYQIHWPQAEPPLAETMAALETLREAGKVRAIGVSNFGVSYLREALAAGRVESNQLAYSLLWRPVEHAVAPLCVEQDVSIVCYSPLAQGLLTGKFISADAVPDGRARTRLFAADRPHAAHGEAGMEAEAFAALDTLRDVADGLGQPMGRVALAWLLAQPGVTSAIAGGRSAAQAAENAAAGDLDLPDDARAKLSAATESLKQKAGTNSDMWRHATRLERPA
mgnify:CR=1 FL=1